ncbi:MAG: hypothetical protein HGB30_05125 [Holophagaceae bacterium]|nr:hypothetical protein [Holophagaceae bacterium]
MEPKKKLFKSSVPERDEKRSSPPSEAQVEAYELLPNPGWNEVRMLADNPEWAQTHPWRLLGARDEDRRTEKRHAKMSAAGILASPFQFGPLHGNFSCYSPIPNPGPQEAALLASRPDWVTLHPWRIMKMREQDQHAATGPQQMVDPPAQPIPLPGYTPGAPTEEEMVKWEKQKVAYAAEFEEWMALRKRHLGK